ncbi:hypothetical protein HYQ46_011914 [Verticillium longisporum]|nr:hypothetical protein HYQ44_008098 [Verticillium longisporum]KAG7152256.1 hypothetical protein HYQ46_011914 [Verticillium longisporum]
MDFIKKVTKSGSADKGATGDQAAAGNQDYADKAFDFASKKSGHNIDRNTQEKITDGGRSAYEKATGSKVSDKISN